MRARLVLDCASSRPGLCIDASLPARLGVLALCLLGWTNCKSNTGSSPSGGAGAGGSTSSGLASGGSVASTGGVLAGGTSGLPTGGNESGGTAGGGAGTGGAAVGGGGAGGDGSATVSTHDAGVDSAADANGGTAGAGGTGGAVTDNGGTTASGGGGSAVGGSGAGGSIIGGSGASGGKAGSGGTAASSGGGSGSGGGGTGGSAVGGSGTGGVAGSGGSSAGVLFEGLQWADTAGNSIQAHGGGVIKVGGYYYWFGENRNPDGTFFAVSCYRSADLVNWEFRNNVLTQKSATELNHANIERPKVIYNATTGQYVMWMHWENGTDYSASRAAVASSSSVDGNYTYLGSARPMVGTPGVVDHGIAGYQSRDATLFVDSDGNAYFISASNENYDLNLYSLKSDYLSISALVAVLFPGGHREAPALWKRNGVYFLLTSAATGWAPNQAAYATSSALASGWSGWTNVGDATTFYSQSAFVLPVTGAAGTAYLYMGDRWAGAWGGPVNDSTFIFLPISFASNTSMSMTWNNTVTIDAAAGIITGATNRFKYVNQGSGKAMAIQNASTADSVAAVQVAYSGGNEQRWILNYDAAGFFNLTNLNSSRVLDVLSGATTDGASIVQFASNGGDNQKWRVVDKGGGAYQLVNKKSSKLAEVPAGATADGIALDQRAASGGSNQLWQMSVAN